LAVNEGNLTKMLVDLSAMLGLDGVPIHFQLFPKLWTDIYHTPVAFFSATIQDVKLCVFKFGLFKSISGWKKNIFNLFDGTFLMEHF
jgi:hypothetical protein